MVAIYGLIEQLASRGFPPLHYQGQLGSVAIKVLL